MPRGGKWGTELRFWRKNWIFVQSKAVLHINLYKTWLVTFCHTRFSSTYIYLSNKGSMKIKTWHVPAVFNEIFLNIYVISMPQPKEWNLKDLFKIRSKAKFILFKGIFFCFFVFFAIIGGVLQKKADKIVTRTLFLLALTVSEFCAFVGYLWSVQEVKSRICICELNKDVGWFVLLLLFNFPFFMWRNALCFN